MRVKVEEEKKNKMKDKHVNQKKKVEQENLQREIKENRKILKKKTGCMETINPNYRKEYKYRTT